MKKYISALMMLLAAAIWGFAFSAQKVAAALPPFTIGAVRSLFAGVFLIGVIVVFDRFSEEGRRLFSKKNTHFIDLNRTELIGGILCGLILAGASALQQSGIGSGTDAGKAAFITALYVLFVPIFGLLLRKKSPLNVWISVAVAVVGFWLLCIKGDFSIAPSDLLVLICASVFALHIIVIDRYSQCDGVRMSCVQFFVAALVNLIVALFAERPISLSAVGENILPLLYLGICSSGIAYTLQIVGQKHAHPAAAAVILSLESVFGVIGSAILLGERMSAREYIGCVIVFLAVVLSQIDVISIVKNKIKKRY